jgi:hypothetical protein
VESDAPSATTADRDPGEGFERRYAAKVAEIEARRRSEATTPLWLSHHDPDEYERCLVVGGRHVCRRCAVFYGVGFTVALTTLAGLRPWPEELDLWFIWLLCIPGTVEFVAEAVGLIRYDARRQALLTVFVGAAYGRGLAYELDDRWSWEFWGPVLVFCTIWFVAVWIGRARAVRAARRIPTRPVGADEGR